MPKSEAPSILWFRDDLRLSDHPALSAAVEEGRTLCVYLWDEESAGLRSLGGASRWWLHYSLASLAADLEMRAGRLDIIRGQAEHVIPALAVAANAPAVFWTRRYGAAERSVDKRVAEALRSRDISSRVFEGSLLHDPERIKTQAGDPYRVFTPFWKALRERLKDGSAVLRAPSAARTASWPQKAPKRVTLESLNLLPRKPDWASGLRETWRPGEAQAHKRVAAFVKHGFHTYAAARDAPAELATSRLSPHLRFGEISPRQVWRAAIDAGPREHVSGANLDKFLSELAWREFSYHLLFHAPELPYRNFNQAFDSFPWRSAHVADVEAWRRGMTGFPIVDAGMRELWRTGYMHNRVRLIVASFLVKDLLIDWRVGERWFWETLCDADPANNAANWQWSAGSGADAAPYFRVFNPSLQSRKFDPSGAYIRANVPELRNLPDKWIHEPWAAPASLLALAGVQLGETYPKPIVDHVAARGRALAALRATRAEA